MNFSISQRDSIPIEEVLKLLDNQLERSKKQRMGFIKSQREINEATRRPNQKTQPAKPRPKAQKTFKRPRLGEIENILPKV